MVERRERRRRDGTVYAVWRARWRDEQGVERSKTFDRAADARVWEAKIRMMKRSGALAELDAGTETLAEFVEEWWLVYAGPNLERSTLRTYATLWNGHALPRLGHLQLRQLTPQTIARFRAELEGAGVGNEAIRKTMSMLQGVLQRAVEWGRVPSNAVKITRKPPKRYRPAVQAIPPSVIEVMRARLLADGRLRDATLLVVLPYAGLRPQEASGSNGATCASARCSSSARSPTGSSRCSRTVASRAPSRCSRRCAGTSMSGDARAGYRCRRRPSS